MEDRHAEPLAERSPSAAPRLLSGYEDMMREAIALGRDDKEVAHSDADAILMELLRKLGYDDLCDLYEEVPKWYA